MKLTTIIHNKMNKGSSILALKNNIIIFIVYDYPYNDNTVLMYSDKKHYNYLRHFYMQIEIDYYLKRRFPFVKYETRHFEKVKLMKNPFIREIMENENIF